VTCALTFLEEAEQIVRQLGRGTEGRTDRVLMLEQAEQVAPKRGFPCS
jgi:hypothetical protein